MEQSHVKLAGFDSIKKINKKMSVMVGVGGYLNLVCLCRKQEGVTSLRLQGSDRAN